MSFKAFATDITLLDGGGFTANSIQRGIHVIVFTGSKQAYVVMPADVEQGAILHIVRQSTGQSIVTTQSATPTDGPWLTSVLIQSSSVSKVNGIADFEISLIYAGATATFYWDADNVTWQYLNYQELTIAPS